MPVTPDKVWEALNEAGLARVSRAVSARARSPLPASRSSSRRSCASSVPRRRGAATGLSLPPTARSRAGSAAPARSRSWCARRCGALADGDPVWCASARADRRGRSGRRRRREHVRLGGVVEVLIEPQLPAPLLAVLGESPSARDAAPAGAARSAGACPSLWRARTPWSSRRWATATRTRWRPRSRADAGYVGLVASAKRAGVVLAELRAQGVVGGSARAGPQPRQASTSARRRRRRSRSRSWPSSSRGGTPVARSRAPRRRKQSTRSAA